MVEEPAALVRRIAAGGGDLGPFEAALCRTFAPRIRLYGLRHLRDEDRARDLVQAVLLAVLEAVRARRVEDPDKIDRFVLGTCRNTARRMRDVESRAEPTPDDVLEEAMTVEVEAPDFSSLVRCFDALDGRAKKVVRLTFQEGRSADEVAAELETTSGNVRVLRHRAIAALRRCLDGHAEGAA